jgi:hypothetical protein
MATRVSSGALFGASNSAVAKSEERSGSKRLITCNGRCLFVGQHAAKGWLQSSLLRFLIAPNKSQKGGVMNDEPIIVLLPCLTHFVCLIPISVLRSEGIPRWKCLYAESVCMQYSQPPPPCPLGARREVYVYLPSVHCQKTDLIRSRCT